MANDIYLVNHLEYPDSPSEIEKGDILLLANGAYLVYYAISRGYSDDVSRVSIEEWIEFKKPIFFSSTAITQVVTRVDDKTILAQIKEKIDASVQESSLYISDITVKDFMSLKNGTIKFSKGINILIGENGSGKSQLLKLLYSVIESSNDILLEKEESSLGKLRIIAKSLTDIFKTKRLGNLVNIAKESSRVNVNLNSLSIFYHFDKNTVQDINLGQKEDVKYISKKSVFIPAKEVLSFFEGFRILYEQKHLAFDKTYYNLCKALEAPLSRRHKLQEITDRLENILGGKIEIINGSFYLVTLDDVKYEISLIAEGLRKVGMLAYLLNNESLDSNSILFWDEPEANMHPKLIDDIVSFLVMLSNRGMQIFISTHSPYIIESFNNHLKKYKIKDMDIDDEEIEKIEAFDPKNLSAYLLENGKIDSIVDEEYGLLDDRLLNNFNDINILYNKMRDIEWNNNG